MTRQIPHAAIAKMQRQLLAWFREHQRDLPWRRSKNPYRIWIAEIMLQQTRIAAVLPYYRRFLRRFPGVESLATAREVEVLKMWSGLGYYSRARNLHRAARQIVAQHDCQFPRDREKALALSGIGAYTAAAVLSIAYDEPLAVLDGNVARVLARLGAIRGDLRAPQRWKHLQNTAQRLLARQSAGDWNQALMELGETICTPQSPRCESCPVAEFCSARALGLTAKIPAPRKKRGAVSQEIAAAILCDSRGRTLLLKDPGAHDDVLFSRLLQFPAVQVARHAGAELRQHLRSMLGVECDALEKLDGARHSVTFRRITLVPFLARVDELPRLARTRVVPLVEFGRLPVSSATRKIAAIALARIS
ncbi:MAG: A/G-specific adenine glycosylase [Candidatus Acidiferrales bacterium]